MDVDHTCKAEFQRKRRTASGLVCGNVMNSVEDSVPAEEEWWFYWASGQNVMKLFDVQFLLDAERHDGNTMIKGHR